MLCKCILCIFIFNIYTAFVQTEMVDLRLLTSICGAEWKNGKELCVNYFKRRDLYEKKIILTNLSSEKCFLICKRMPVTFIFPSLTNEQVFVPVAFCRNRPFHTKLSLGTVIPSH